MGWDQLHRAPGLSNRDFFGAQLASGFTIVADGARRVPAGNEYQIVYYAAIRDERTGDVSASVILMRWTPASFLNFTYKWMDETVLPIECEAPESVLAALTATEHESALQWRQNAAAAAERRSDRPTVSPGDRVRFTKPLHFTNGLEQTTFTLVKRSTFRTGGLLVKIPNWLLREHALVKD
jgi:hypothetical protein